MSPAGLSPPRGEMTGWTLEPICDGDLVVLIDNGGSSLNHNHVRCCDQ